MSRHEIKRNDTRPFWPVDIVFSDGSSPDISGGTVRFIARDALDKSVKIDAAATVIDDNAGGLGTAQVEYRFQSGDTDVAGDYDCEWEVTFSDATVQTFPTRRYDRLRVIGDLA